MREVLGRLDEKIDDLNEQVTQLLEKMNSILDTHHLRQRPLSSGDSLSIRDEDERQFILKLIRSYRSLPPDQRRQYPELIDGAAKIQVVAGCFEEAERDFRELATVTADPRLKAEACYNAYLAALEKRARMDFPTNCGHPVKGV